MKENGKMLIPKTDNIMCRLVGGPEDLRNMEVYQDKYNPTISVCGVYDYVDYGILNAKGEHLFFYKKVGA